MQIGILGGTFDPPHLGHLAIAREAQEALELDRVYFIPAPHPPHKLGEPVSPFHARVEMLRRAIAGNPSFAISLIEANRPGPSYTADTLRELKRQFAPETELYFIMGMDSLEELPTWHEPQELVKLARLAVLRRPGYDPELVSLQEKVPGILESIVFIVAPEVAISSSDIQARVRAGQSIDELVPPGVAEYIEEHHLYERGL